MNLLSLIALLKTIWPAVAGVLGALYFASVGNYQQALTVLLAGLGVGHVLFTAGRPKA